MADQQTPKSLSLLDALLRLEQHAEGRRTARKTLTEAVRTLDVELCRRLRVGDAVTVDNRTVRVERVGYYGCQGGAGSGWPVLRCPDTETSLVVNGSEMLSDPGRDEDGRPMTWHDGRNTQRATGRVFTEHVPLFDEDPPITEDAQVAGTSTLTWVAEHAAAIVAAFGDKLRADRERMDAATAQVRTGRV